MAKAGSKHLDNQAMYDGMIAAYTGGNIGVISNDISKIYNKGGEIIMEAVKWLVMENNFVMKSVTSPGNGREKAGEPIKIGCRTNA